MSTSPHTRAITVKPYLVGIVLALLLTIIPFSLVAVRPLPPIQIFAIIGVAAIAQVIVHLTFFLHLDLKPSSHDKMTSLSFALVLLFIMVGGSLWIMFDLNYRMM